MGASSRDAPSLLGSHVGGHNTEISASHSLDAFSLAAAAAGAAHAAGRHIRAGGRLIGELSRMHAIPLFRYVKGITTTRAKHLLSWRMSPEDHEMLLPPATRRALGSARADTACRAYPDRAGPSRASVASDCTSLIGNL